MMPSLTRFAPLLTLALCSTASCTAGTITGLALAQDLQVANLELTDLGFDPTGFFFFSGNTAYDFTGIYEVEIIAATLNPAGATSLDGYTTNQVTFDIDNSGNVASMTGVSNLGTVVPEPSQAMLLLGGMALILCGRRRKLQLLL